MTREVLHLIPHLQVGGARIQVVPPRAGVEAHRRFIARTACGLERDTTLCTRSRIRVRCPDCMRELRDGE